MRHLFCKFKPKTVLVSFECLDVSQFYRPHHLYPNCYFPKGMEIDIFQKKKCLDINDIKNIPMNASGYRRIF